MASMQDVDPEKVENRQPHNHSTSHRFQTIRQTISATPSSAFIGRLGGNQEFVIDPDDAANAELLERTPDAAPGMTLRQQFDCKPFVYFGLWKAAFIEGVGTFMLVFVSAWANISPNVIPQEPTPQFGYFANAAYLGPLTGGISNFLLLTLFTFSFGVTTGAHLNPSITIATFFARLCSFPRAVLYMSFQILGAALAGLMVRAGYGSRDWQVGGCWMYSDIVPVREAFAIEFMACLTLFFIAFGVGLDPRQRSVIPPSLSPFLVGMTLGVLSWSTGYSRYGYGGASMNPARCFGTFVGSHIPGWHWIHWVAPVCASIVHAFCYLLVPPGVSVY